MKQTVLDELKRWISYVRLCSMKHCTELKLEA